MKYHSYRSATHPIHEDITPIISALRHGRPNIANLRFKRLLRRSGSMQWEGVVIRNLIHKRMQDKKDVLHLIPRANEIQQHNRG